MTLHSAVKVVYGGRHLKRTRERFVVFDSKLFMASHITKICASSFYYIYNVLGSESIFQGSHLRYLSMHL